MSNLLFSFCDSFRSISTKPNFMNQCAYGQPRDAKYWHSACFACIVHYSSIHGNIKPLSTNKYRIWAPLPDEMMKTIIYECCVPPCMHLYRKLSSLSFDSFHNKFSQRLSVCPVHGTTMRMTSLIPAIAVVSTSVLPYCHYRFLHFAGVTNITSDCTTIMTRDVSCGLPCQTNDTSNPILTLSPSLNCVDFIQRHYQPTAYQYVSEHGHSNFTMFTYICITDGVNYSRITLRFSITRIKPPTTDFPPVPDDILKVVRVNAKQTDTRRYTCKMHGLECSGCGECKVSALSQELKNVRHVFYQAETHVSPS